MNNKKVLFLVFVALTGLFACKKGGEAVTNKFINEITLINAGADTLNVYENGTRINNGSTLLPGGQYLDLTVTAGIQRYQFKKAGSANALFEAELNIDSVSSYTVFVAGRSADQTFVLKNDAFTSDTLAHVRFVNASPDAGNINFTIGALPSFTAQAFKSATAFLSVPAGKIFYSMYREGQSTPLASGTITVNKGAYYNLFSKGLINGTGTNALGARILIAQ